MKLGFSRTGKVSSNSFSLNHFSLSYSERHGVSINQIKQICTPQSGKGSNMAREITWIGKLTQLMA